MRLHRGMVGLLIGLVSVLACAATVPAGGGAGRHEVPGPVRDRLARHHIPQRDVSIYVRRVTGPDPAVLTVNATDPRNPASVIKLLTTLATLDELGPSYSWKTKAYVDGDLRRGRLKGDLYIKGYGDPYLTPESFWSFVHALRNRGLRTVRGDLVLDDRYFAAEAGDRGDFDGRPQRAYNALPYALSLNFQATRVHLVPDRESRLVRVFSEPTLENLTIHNRLKPVSGPCRRSRAHPTFTVSDGARGAIITLSGQYSTQCDELTYTRLVMDPAAHVGGAFEAMWHDSGGILSGKLRQGAVPEGAELYYVMPSRPLGEVIRGMNKYSNNLMSRLLFLSLGAERFGPPGTLSKGRDAVAAWLEEAGLHMPELVMENGAGLSRRTRISAQHVGELLRLAYASPVMPEFMASLSVLGVDGTLRRRLRETPLAGRIHAKTGSLNDVSAMAGYVLDRAERRWIVVLLINHKGVAAWQGKQVQDALLQWVYEGPEPAILRGGVKMAAQPP